MFEDQAFSAAANGGYDPNRIHVPVVATEATTKRRLQLDAGDVFWLDRGAQFQRHGFTVVVDPPTINRGPPRIVVSPYNEGRVELVLPILILRA